MEEVKFDPDWVVAPGETLDEWFEEMHLPKTIARHYGLSEPVLTRIIEGKQRINADIAKRLEGMTQIDARMWLALEHNFRVGLKAGKMWSGLAADDEQGHRDDRQDQEDEQ